MTVRGLKSLLLAHNKSEDSWDGFNLLSYFAHNDRSNMFLVLRTLNDDSVFAVESTDLVGQ